MPDNLVAPDVLALEELVARVVKRAVEERYAEQLEELVPGHEASSVVGLSKSRIARRVRLGTFPPPVFVGDRKFWKRGDLLAWLKAETARPPNSRRKNLVPFSGGADQQVKAEGAGDGAGAP